jgi:hypothetical protein
MKTLLEFIQDEELSIKPVLKENQFSVARNTITNQISNIQAKARLLKAEENIGNKLDIVADIIIRYGSLAKAQLDLLVHITEISRR